MDMHGCMSCHDHGGESPPACMRDLKQGGHVPGVAEVRVVLHEQRGGQEAQGIDGGRHAHALCMQVFESGMRKKESEMREMEGNVVLLE